MKNRFDFSIVKRSGDFVLRIDPQLHRKLVALSREEGASLNGWLESRLRILTKQEDEPGG
jgi:predicted HicB family RNase H-like nuclease